MEQARERLRIFRVSDEEIRQEIAQGEARWGEVWDPHTATAAAVRGRVEGEDWIIVSTAHPAKFEAVVEPLIGRDVDVPPALEEITRRPSRTTEIDPELPALLAAMGD